MSDMVFTGSKAYCTRKVRDLQSRGWKIVHWRDLPYGSDRRGGQQVYTMTYVGMELNHTGMRYVTK